MDYLDNMPAASFFREVDRILVPGEVFLPLDRDREKVNCCFRQSGTLHLEEITRENPSSIVLRQSKID